MPHASRGEIIGIVGICVTLLVGIPAAIALFVGGDVGLAVLTLLLGITLIVVLSLVVYSLHLPNWTVKQRTDVMWIQDTGGVKAVFRKTLQLRANRRGLEHYIHRNIGGDGSTSGYRTERTTKIIQTENEAKNTAITVKFLTAPAWHQVIETYLELDCDQMFTGAEEGLVMHVDQPICRARAEVHFPEGRYPTGAILLYRYNESKQLHDPTITDGRVIWESRARWFGKLPFGSYTLRWWW